MEYQGLDKTVGIEVGQILDFLKSELTGLGCQVEIKQRGFFGKVLRFSRDEVFLFDALPAKNWVKFYFSSKASRKSAFS